MLARLLSTRRTFYKVLLSKICLEKYSFLYVEDLETLQRSQLKNQQDNPDVHYSIVLLLNIKEQRTLSLW